MSRSRTYPTVLLGELPNLPDAACASHYHDPDLWFPYREFTSFHARYICGSCPERAACLAFALEHPEVRGIWGGLNDGQRARMRKAA